jgi:hypothetical protein
MLLAGLGSTAAAELGLLPRTFADAPETSLRFGELEPLVGLLQETPIEKLLPTLAERLRGGTELRQLLAAAALSNARTFGGEDYVGFHTLMALAPSFHMAGELPAERRALPVLKVLYRNSNRIQEFGGKANEVLHLVKPAPLPAGWVGGEVLRQKVREQDIDAAERTFAALAQGSPEDAFNHLLIAVEDHTEVHRVVLPYRAWDLLGLIGKEHAHTLLRQSVRYCVKAEKHAGAKGTVRKLLEKAFDDHKLLGRTLGSRPADDAWIDRFSQSIFEATPEQAVDAAAAALADGILPDAIGEAISVAANQLVLRDSGRLARYASAAKPAGSVHGDSIGVHTSDAVNAWRSMARVANPRNTCASIILAAYEVASARGYAGKEVDFLAFKPRPYAEHLEKIQTNDAAALLAEADAAIRDNDQGRACAAVHRYGALGFPERPVFDLLLGYAISQDGALHAEKYYRTVTEEFASTRPAFRWRQLVGLARVTASEHGYPAPGYEEARELLKGVSAS